MFVAVFVFTEKELSVVGPFDSRDEAKAFAKTMSSDPDEALVCKVTQPSPVGDRGRPVV